jgi:hypothetical protein
MKLSSLCIHPAHCQFHKNRSSINGTEGIKPFCGLYFEAQRPKKKKSSNPDACVAYSKLTLKLEGLYNEPLADVMFATGVSTSTELEFPSVQNSGGDFDVVTRPLGFVWMACEGLGPSQET